MVFWLLAITVTAIACAALYYAAAGRTVNAAGPAEGDANRHFRQMLAGIEADLASGKIAEPEAEAAKGELAREMLRQEAETAPAPVAKGGFGRIPVLVALVGIVGIAFGLYAAVGSPGLPGQPLATRPETLAADLDLDAAIATIEERLAASPDDLRGWTVIAPAYMDMQRYEDAERAFRRILELSGPSPDAQTDLAEALILQNEGDATGEAMELLESAAASDPSHLRSRFYIAGELTRRGEFDAAASAWEELLALANGDEPWIATAQEGLAFARNGGVAPQPAVDEAAIAAMVEGLSARLTAEGGTVEEWTQLVRSLLVLDNVEEAQAAYDAAVAAYPQAFDRGELDTIALDAGLELNGERQ